MDCPSITPRHTLTSLSVSSQKLRQKQDSLQLQCWKLEPTYSPLSEDRSRLWRNPTSRNKPSRLNIDRCAAGPRGQSRSPRLVPVVSSDGMVWPFGLDDDADDGRWQRDIQARETGLAARPGWDWWLGSVREDMLRTGQDVNVYCIYCILKHTYSF